MTSSTQQQTVQVQIKDKEQLDFALGEVISNAENLLLTEVKKDFTAFSFSLGSLLGAVEQVRYLCGIDNNEVDE